MGTAVAAALVTAGVGQAAAAVLGPALANLAGGLLLSTASRALGAGGSRTQSPIEVQEQELRQPTSLPAKRHVYGDTEAVGTPAPVNVVKDGKLYGVWLVNSRPSAGPFTLRLDKRPVELAGDPYDFDGGGASATNEPFAGYIRVWIGRGEQTAPPAAVTAAVPYSEGNPTWFKETDAWRGCTVVWMEIDVGKTAERANRWPSLPPDLALRGPWSYVWDPRDPAQSLDDPATWLASDNQALCTLDALTQSPVAPLVLDDLILDLCKWAADVADEDAAKKGGATEKRYRVQGTLVYSADAELEDQIEPLLAAGATELVQIGGRRGLLPAAPIPAAYTLSEILDSYEFERFAAGDGGFGQVRTTYVSADRDYETADLGPWPVPDAPAAATRVFDHPLTMVQSGTQAQRLRWIEGQRLLLQKRFSSVGPPEMIQLLPGARVTGALPDRPRFNGSWQAVSLRSAASLTGDDEGVALRTPFVLREYSDAVFAYDAELHEQELTTLPTDFAYPQVEPPGEIEITAGPGVDFDAGSAIVSRLRFAAPPSPTASVTHYELQMTNVTADEPGAWISAGLIDADLRDTAGKVYGWIHNPPVDPEFDIRLRAMVGSSASAWVVKESVSVAFGITVNSSAPAAGLATFNVTMPGSLIGQGARIWRAETGDGFGEAEDISGVLAMGPGETANISAAADAGEADFFVTAVSRTGSDGPAAGPFTLTIT